MANRQTTFLLKRSNVPGKIPPMSGLTIGELALNTADAILYTSGTTSNSILPIGWDRIHRTGDTVTGDFNFYGGLSAVTISATTYQNLPDNVTGNYLPLSGGTVYGPTNYTNGLTANTLNVTGLTQTSGVTSTGGIIFPHKTLTTNYTATTADYFLNITGDTLDVFLMTAVDVEGKLLVVKNEGSGIVNVISQFGELIDDRNDVLLTQGNSVQLVSDGVNWAILGYNISSTQANTGVIEFSGLSKVSSSTFSVARVKGFIVDDVTNPTIPFLTFVQYSGGTHTALYVSSSTETYVYLTSGGTIGQTVTPLTEQQRRQNIFLGKLGHADRTSIINAFSQPDFVLTPLAQLRDMFQPIGFVNGGVVPYANATNLTFATTANYLYGLGINFSTDALNPNQLYVSGNTATTFQYRTQTGGTASNVTNIDPLNYDLNGVITPLSGTKATNQRIYLIQNGVFRIQYGQTSYSNFAAAVAGISTETFNTFSNFRDNAILIGILTVLSTTSDLTDTSKAQFFLASKFGETVGTAGGISTTNLQQAYNNSTSPEIVINATLDGLTIKNGTGNADNVTILLEGQTGTNGITSFIRADGYISGTTFQSNGFIGNSNGITATTVSATTYYNLPTDIRVTGGTYSDNTFTYTNNTGGTFNTLFNTMTGLTINGDLTVTGGTQSIFSGNSSSDLVRITQTGSGNALTIEDTTNPDSTPFVINATGSVGIGTTTPTAKLTVFTSAAIGYPATSGTSQTGYYSRLRNTTSNLVLDMGGNGAFGNWLQSTNQLDLSLTFPLLLNPNGGNVGIGAIDPQTNLHVSGSTLISGTLTATTISSTTINATNLYVTGGTQSVFSGNSSSELVRITQTGVGDAFVVEDSANSDNTHFVINASGNTAIGLTQPIGDDKLTVSGNTTVYGTVSATTYAGGGVNNGKLLSITELTASTLATHTVATSTVFTAINCNSDATNRYAKITFTAPASAIVEIIFESDIVFVNSAAVQMIGLHSGSTSTTTPSKGWFRINGDADASSASYRASFIINSLTPGTSYTYYVMSVCNFSGNLVRCGSLQTGAYVSGADRPSPLRIYARDIGTTVITTNPSS